MNIPFVESSGRFKTIKNIVLCFALLIMVMLPSVSLALDPNTKEFGDTSPYLCSDGYASQAFTYCGVAGCYNFVEGQNMGGNCGSDIENRFYPRPLIGCRITKSDWNGYPIDVVTYFYGPLPPLPVPGCDWGITTCTSCTNSYAAQEINHSSVVGPQVFPKGYLMGPGCGSGEDYRTHFPGQVVMGCVKTEHGGDWNGWPTDLYTFYYAEPLLPYG